MKTDEEILEEYIQQFETEGLSDEQIQFYKNHVKESPFFKFHLASERLKETLFNDNGFISKVVDRLAKIL